ncbi:MAG: hypothetical protein U0R19_23955 [Bryobacteraceae bacterium]
MKPEYDFSKGERGRFYKENAEVRLPIYLDSEVQRYLLVNGMLKREIQIIESVK